MYSIYIVKKGDTLSQIANDYNTTVTKLYEINNLAPNSVIKEDDKLIIPLEDERLFDYYTIKQGDSLYKIATLYQVDVSSLAALNGIDNDDYIYPEQTILIPKENVDFYVTRNSDTINTVSDKLYNSPVDILLQNKNVYLLPDQLIIYKKS